MSSAIYRASRYIEVLKRHQHDFVQYHVELSLPPCLPGTKSLERGILLPLPASQKSEKLSSAELVSTSSRFKASSTP